MAQNVQIVIQGGGAKLTSIIAAIEALQQCEDSGIVGISRIVGTSAGAIAAVIHAFGVRINQVDGSMLSDAIELIKKSEDIKNLQNEGFLADSGRLLRLYRGGSLIDDEFLPSLIHSVLSGVGIAPDAPIADSRIPLSICAASLAEEKAVFLRSDDESTSQTTVAEALYASCNIPLLFSSFNTPKDWRNAYVDGGLCENLPVKPFLNEAAEFGRTIAISLHPDMKAWPPRNARDFISTLFDVAINNSVSRAKALLGAENILHIKSNQSSMDFVAISPTFRVDKSYLDTRNRCLFWMKERFSTMDASDTSTEKRFLSAPPSSEILRQNYESILLRMRGKKFQVDYSAMIAHTDFLPEQEKLARGPDILFRAHRIGRQEGFRLQEYPIGISAIDPDWTISPTIRVEKLFRGGRRQAANFEISPFMKEGVVFGENKVVYRYMVTLEDPLKEKGESSEEGDPEGVFIWYEQKTPCLFSDIFDDEEEYDSLGLQVSGNTKAQLNSIYLIICGDMRRAQVSCNPDPMSVPLDVIDPLNDLPSELGFLCDASRQVRGWRAENVPNGKGARLRLTT